MEGPSVTGGHVVESKVESFKTTLKVIEEHRFYWQTTLQLEPGERFITSECYILDYGTPDETHWRMELDPNYKDEHDVRYLSAYFKLEKTCRKDAVIPALYYFQLLTNNEQDESQDHIQHGGVSKFSMQKPSYGFSRFIPFSKLGPFGDSKNTEKLGFKAMLTIMKDISKPSPPKTQEDPITITSKIPFDPQLPLKQDKWVKYGLDKISVDSHRINQYTTYFQKYFVPLGKRHDKETPDLAEKFNSRGLINRVLNFCQKGDVVMPRQWDELVKLLDMAVKLNIVQLRNLCQQTLLSKMQVSNITEIVKLVLNESLDEKLASPVIWKFMLANIAALDKDTTFQDSYVAFREYYESLMLEDDPSEDEEEKS